MNRPSPTTVWRAVLLALAVAASPAAAALDWYTVEVLVFAEQSSDGLDEEAWPAAPGWPEDALAVQPGNGEFQALSRGQLELNAVARQLDRSGRYRTLLVTGWRQPGFGPRRAVPVRVRSESAGDGLDVAPQAGLLSVFGAGGPEPAVDGIVRVHRSRYLHVLVDLVYSRPEPLAEGDDAQRTSLYRLTGTRRMRSRELHYYDHPMFGVLVRIVPYGAQQEPEPSEEPSTQQ